MRKFYISKLGEILKKQNEGEKDQAPPKIPGMPPKPSFKTPGVNK
jgi:hypothetical protein